MDEYFFRFGKMVTASAIFVLVSLLYAHANAAEKNVPTFDEAAKQPLSDLVDGVVTGQLVTVAANNFFQYFIARWRDQPLNDRYSITVHERPSAIRGSLIRIECLNKTIFLATLPNSHGDMKAFAERAAAIAYENASQADVQRLLFRDADLAPDEL